MYVHFVVQRSIYYFFLHLQSYLDVYVYNGQVVTIENITVVEGSGLPNLIVNVTDTTIHNYTIAMVYVSTPATSESS